METNTVSFLDAGGSLTTAATGAITAAETAVVAILVAGLVITIAFWSYGKIKAAIRKN